MGLCLGLAFWFGVWFTLPVCLKCGDYRFGVLGVFWGLVRRGVVCCLRRLVCCSWWILDCVCF